LPYIKEGFAGEKSWKKKCDKKNWLFLLGPCRIM